MEVKPYFGELNKILDKLDESQIQNLMDVIYNAYKNGKMVFVIGNGGSYANAEHFAQDLAKGTLVSQKQTNRIKAMSFSNASFMTAQANDDGYDSVFVQPLISFASKGDVLIVISGSGNSPNVVKAMEYANANGLETVSVSGFSGGKIHEISKHKMHVPCGDMCMVESVHSIIFHYIASELKMRINS
ncbi:SIS domain-containing protein [bacterium]|nr:SIS domain-containing protein [bacterium]